MRGVRKDLSSGCKECPKCLETKTLSEYHICKNGTPNGYCRECTKIKNASRKYRTRIVIKEGYKVCTTCKKELLLSDFYKDPTREYKPRPSCKECGYSKQKVWTENNREQVNARSLGYYYKNHKVNCSRLNETSSKRRARLRSRPEWSNKNKIQLIFVKAKELSLRYNIEFHVDHVVPLRSKYVSGLHTEDNLQLLEKGINLKKKDLYWPDMPVIDKELKQMAKEFYAKAG